MTFITIRPLQERGSLSNCLLQTMLLPDSNLIPIKWSQEAWGRTLHSLYPNTVLNK